jgi:antitoxin (DNA-binding transcriptional repressor) of toxin-antitoxin stability system
MATVTIQTAESKLSLLLALVEAGEEIIIARGEDPIAKLVPFGSAVPKPQGKRQFGALKGQLSIGPEFFEPLPDEELDAWEQ